MPDPADSLLLDLVEWVATRPRSYGELMDAWRTSCPRMPVWEEAVTRALVVRRTGESGEATVLVTPAGRAMLRAHGRPAGAKSTRIAAPRAESRV
jgi:hypothetical protein